MSATGVFLAGVATTAVTSLLVIGYLRGPLRSILTDLCGTLERANFWLAFSNVTLVLVPLIFALSNQTELTSARSAVFEIGAQIRLALIGLVVSVVIVGIVIGSFIPRTRAQAALGQSKQSA